MTELPDRLYNTDKDSPGYNPYRDPMSFFFGMDENFVPTPEKPLQQPRCAHITKAGEMCTQRAVLGTGYAGIKPLCRNHGGTSKGVREQASDVVEAARMMLTSSVPSALDKLVKFATANEGVAQNIQLAAIKEILDRAGVKHETTQKVEVEVTQSYKSRVAEQLAKLAPSKDEANDDEDEDILEDMGEQEER